MTFFLGNEKFQRDREKEREREKERGRQREKKIEILDYITFT